MLSQHSGPEDVRAARECEEWCNQAAFSGASATVLLRRHSRRRHRRRRRRERLDAENSRDVHSSSNGGDGDEKDGLGPDFPPRYEFGGQFTKLSPRSVTLTHMDVNIENPYIYMSVRVSL